MWRPFLKLSMLKSEESGEFSPLQFAMREKQGFRDHGTSTIIFAIVIIGCT